MASSTANIDGRAAATDRVPGRPGATARAPFAPTLALVLVLALGAFAVVMPAVLIVDRPTPLPAPFAPQNQDAETLLFVVAFAVLLPAALLVAPRLASRIRRAQGDAALLALAAGLAGALCGLVLGLKVLERVGAGTGVKVALAAGVAWWALAAGLLGRAGASRPWEGLHAAGRRAGAAWWAVAVLIGGALLCLTSLPSITVPVALAGALAIALAVAVVMRGGAPRPPPPLGFALDVVAVGVLALAVPDLVIFRPEDAARDFTVALDTQIIQFHQDFLLGPANQILHGGAMLVDTASQYGVGSVLLLVGWSKLVPIGYGTFGFLDGALTAAFFAAAYVVLRLAGVARSLAAATMAVAIVALVLNLAYPVGALPQYGPLRFGLPMAVVLAAVLAARRPRWAGAADAGALATLGLSSIWSLESFAYTAAVLASVVGVRVWLWPDGSGRRRELGRRAALAGAACLVAHALFAGITLAATGQLPDWGLYLAYLREFLLGNVGNLTYDVSPWSPALALGAGYAASAAALVELGRRRAPVLDEQRPAVVALAGLTVYGIALLSYFVDRSQDYILMRVALPGLLLGTIWLSVLLRAGARVPRPARLGGLATGLSVGVLLAAVAWSSVPDRFPRSALAHAAPGGSSLRGALHRLWHPPALDPAAPAGARLIERYDRGDPRPLLLVAPDLATEIQLRTGRVDRLFVGYSWETSLVPDQHIADVRAVVAALRPGDRLLLDGHGLAALAFVRAHPGVDPLGPLAPAQLSPLQRLALRDVDRRFRLAVVHREGGFTVVQLQNRAR